MYVSFTNFSLPTPTYVVIVFQWYGVSEGAAHLNVMQLLMLFSSSKNDGFLDDIYFVPELLHASRHPDKVELTHDHDLQSWIFSKL